MVSAIRHGRRGRALAIWAEFLNLQFLMNMVRPLLGIMALLFGGCIQYSSSFTAQSPGRLELTLSRTNPISGTWSIPLGQLSGGGRSQYEFWFPVRLHDP